MSLSLFARKAVVWAGLAVAVGGLALGQGIYITNGIEFPITGTLPGDQVHPALAITTNGGFLVWEDNVTDGNGLGISALRLDSSFSRVLSPFRVNQVGAGNQERPQCALLSNGGAAFVWQGGEVGFQHIYARFLSASNLWVTGDVLVSADKTKHQINPAIATLANGNVVVVYSSFNQANSNSLQDVYAQVMSPTGQKIGGEFMVNSFVPFNQRSATVAALKDGGFAVAWVSEQQIGGAVDNLNPAFLYSTSNSLPSVNIFLRRYNAAGAPLGYETLVDSGGENPCGSPSIAAGADGGFLVAWNQKDMASTSQNSWDIWARAYLANGAAGATRVVNTTLYGDQYIPRVASLGNDYLIVWTSLGQDGSREGVYGQFVRSDGSPSGGEFRVNTTTLSQQLDPVVTSDGYGEFLAVFTSFTGLAGSFDLFAQRYIDANLALQPMNPPFVIVPFTLVSVGTSNIYQPQIQVSWPIQAGLPVDHYEVFVDGSGTPAASLTTNVWVMTGITKGSTHTFQVSYVLSDQRHSPPSAPATATAWLGMSYSGVPAEWMAMYFGDSWPPANVPVVPGGPTPLQAFLTGASPLDPSTWLRTGLISSPQGYFLAWNPQPGLTYQVQSSSDLETWTNYGAPRFAAGSQDSVFVGGNNTAYYRLLRLR